MNQLQRTDNDSKDIGEDRRNVSEFPTFTNWVFQIFKGLVASLFLILVFYPAFALPRDWLG